MSLKTKILVITNLTILIVGFLIVVLITTSVKPRLTDKLEKRGVSIARNIAEQIVNPLLTENFFEIRMMINDQKKIEEDIVAYIFVLDSSGSVVAHTFEKGFPAQLRAFSKVQLGGHYRVYNLNTEKGRILHIAVPLMKNQAGSLHLGLLYEPIQRDIRDITTALIWIILGALGMGSLASVIFAGVITKPLSKLVGVAREVAGGNLSERVKISTGDEIGELGQKFNEMLDIRQEAEEKARQSEVYIKNILESVNDAFIVVDQEYRIISVNRAYCAQANMPPEEIIGKQCYEISHRSNVPCFMAGERCPVKHTLESHAPDNVVHVHRGSDGLPFDIEIRSFPLMDSSGTVKSVIEVIRDVSEKRRLEEQLRQSQKMEAIGILSGGIAHDFNNILQAVVGCGELLGDSMEAGDPRKKYIEVIMSSAGKATDLIKGLLAFSRKQISNQKTMDINQILRNAEKILSRVIGEDIELVLDLSPQDIIVLADPSQMDQVLMNLVTNARDAMPEGGRLKVSSEVIEIDDEFVRTYNYGTQGMYGLVSVSDTGKGMDKETLEKIFDPFFSTKEVGKGTGLGLAVVYGIVEQHNGVIHAYSELGKGSTFKIYLPLAKAPPEGPAAAEEETLAVGGTETLLLAEDNEEIRAFLKDMIERRGYNVLEASDGEEAVRLFEEHRGKIRLLLFDMVMPRMDGKKAYDRIRETRPDIRAIFITGYATAVINEKAASIKDVDFISKPVSPKKLLRKIRQALDERPSQDER